MVATIPNVPPPGNGWRWFSRKRHFRHAPLLVRKAEIIARVGIIWIIGKDVRIA